MIVNLLPDGWEIVFQPAHALLSAQLAARWRHETEPPRWPETLVAVAQHDNGWWEWEQEPRLNEDGTPRNFTEMTPHDAIAQWRRGIARGQQQGRWVGLLVSRHATALYGNRVGELPALDAFLAEQGAQQAAWMTALEVTEGAVGRAYAMVRWTDWLSLLLAWRRVPTDGSAVSVGDGPDGRRYSARRLAEGAITVDPWPFVRADFEVWLERRCVAQHHFEDGAALRAALAAAPVTERRWQLQEEP